MPRNGSNPEVASSPVSSPSASDRELIGQLVARFDDATNRRDEDGFRALWTKDASWSIGQPRPMSVTGLDAIVAEWHRLLGATEWFFRASYAGIVDVSGDEAVGRWPCLEMSTVSHPQSAAHSGYENRAFYEDYYVRREDRWLFSKRRYVYFWISDAPIKGQAVPATGDTLSDMPSYAAAKSYGVADQ